VTRVAGISDYTISNLLVVKDNQTRPQKPRSRVTAGVLCGTMNEDLYLLKDHKNFFNQSYTGKADASDVVLERNNS
jgi:hypothetical protein